MSDNNSDRAGRLPPQVKACKCKHAAQDGYYGAGNRLFVGKGGRTTRSNKPIIYRCSVCGSN